MIKTQITDKIFSQTPNDFVKIALDFFHHQAKHNTFYGAYLEKLNCDVDRVEVIQAIPFLPIQFFKTQQIITREVELSMETSSLIFESSGTTAQVNSKHFVQDAALYERSFMGAFEKFYGDVREYCIMGLLPSYLERGQSSLVYMVNDLISKSQHPLSDFYLYNHDELYANLQALEAAKQKTILVGVTYALLDFAEKYSMPLQHAHIVETGGMKGRRKEMIREEVHQILKSSFNLNDINAEYGMTELLSQAYSKGKGIFNCPPWMKVLVRDVNDPFQISLTGKGVLNIIDLANIHSCCFIATDDIGEVFADGSFTVQGRLDLSDLRGCSLMYES